MNGIPMEFGLLLSAVLFVLGLIGVLVRRNLIMILMSLEVMLNATGLAFIVAGSRWGAGGWTNHVPADTDTRGGGSGCWPGTGAANFSPFPYTGCRFSE